MSGEKTEEPTEEKLRKERERGNVADRKHVVETTLLALGVSLAYVTATEVGETLFVALGDIVDRFVVDPSGAYEFSVSLAREVALFSVGTVAAVAVAATLFALFVNRFNFAPKALLPKFEKLNPVNGLKNVFSMKTLYNFIKSLVIFAVITLTVYLIVRQGMEDAVAAAACGFVCLAEVFSGFLTLELTVFSLILAITAYIDFRIQSRLHLRQNKMTKDEVKRERKGFEGDPQINSARRNIAMRDAFEPAIAAATHIVYSKSELIAFVAEENRVPFVAFKISGSRVARIQREMRAAGKRCIHAPRAASRLFKGAKVGEYLGDRQAVADWVGLMSDEAEAGRERR